MHFYSAHLKTILLVEQSKRCNFNIFHGQHSLIGPHVLRNWARLIRNWFLRTLMTTTRCCDSKLIIWSIATVIKFMEFREFWRCYLIFYILLQNLLFCTCKENVRTLKRCKSCCIWYLFDRSQMCTNYLMNKMLNKNERNWHTSF